MYWLNKEFNSPKAKANQIQMEQIINNFLNECKSRDYTGVVCIGKLYNDFSHKSVVGISGDANFEINMVQQLIRTIASECDVPAKTIATKFALYFAELENGDIDEEIGFVSRKALKRAGNVIRREIDLQTKGDFLNGNFDSSTTAD